MRRDIIETWVSCKNNEGLFAFPSTAMIEIAIKRNADCFATEGILDVVSPYLYSCISLSNYKALSKLLFENMQTVSLLVYSLLSYPL